MGELGALFNPGMRHELEERRSRAARREEEGNARDGDLRIDLASGIAVINVPGEDQDAPADGSGESADSSGESAAVERVTDADRASDGPGGDASGQEPAPAPAEAAAVDTPAEKPADPAPRPRGKRGLSASRR